jgi:flavin reductase (DIM6/NTAB) family NADH-FMN oxidoreductase RutF
MKSFAPKPWFAPQPVLIIGTYNKDGVANAMNAAWAGQWDMKEIMISMGNHVTTDNLKLGGEFTVAFATKKTMVASDFVGIVSAKNDPKKMEKTGWNIEKATMVNAPVFTDFPMTLECRIKEKYDESETGYYLVAEIVNILVDEKYLAEDGNPDMEKMELIVFDPIHHGFGAKLFIYFVLYIVIFMCKYAISAICITLKSQLHILAEWCERKSGHLEMLFSPRNADDRYT